MDTKVCEYILEIARQKSITKAAEALEISQSALSQCLIRVEKEMGAPLFNRKKTSLSPTDAGKLYIEAAEKMVDTKRRLQAEISSMAGRKRICIGVSSVWGMDMMMEIIPQFREKYPEITLEQTEEEGTAASIIASKQWCISDRDRAYLELLEGKTVNFIGDSLFAGNSLGEHLVWPALLGMKYNMSFRNYGISGCTLSACEGGKNPIINRYQSMADNDPDIVIFEGGRNDYNKCAALGTVEDADITTYRGAVAELIRGLREKYPNAVIIGVTFWRASDRANDVGLSCNVYTDAMKEVCAELGVPYIDATDEEASGIKMTDKSFRLEYSMQAGDVCHLNTEGMRLALKFFEAEIARIYTEATAAADK